MSVSDYLFNFHYEILFACRMMKLNIDSFFLCLLFMFSLGTDVAI